jgi:Peptidase M50B-like
VDRERASAQEKFLVVALLVTLVLWNVPYGWVALYPFKIFATWLHESSHAFFMVILGAGLDRLEIFRDTSGLAYPASGVAPVAQAVISSAGYMGTAFAGAFFLVLGRTERGARWVLAGIGAAMAAVALIGVRNGFGLVAVVAEGLALLALARWSGPRLAGFLVNFLAAQSCINAVLDIRVLFGATKYVDGLPRAISDADQVARVVGGPPALWATFWLVWSFALFYAALRWVRAPRRLPARAAATV